MSTGIVDSHQHFWQVGRFDYPWMSSEPGVLCQDYLPTALAPLLKQSGVSGTVLVQASNSLDETSWLLSLANQHSFIGGVVGWVDLTSPDAGRQLDEFGVHPMFKGVRHLVESEPHNDWLNQPNVRRGLSQLAARGITYDLLVHTRHLKYAAAVAEQCPELRLVIDHMSKPPIVRGEISEWAGELKRISAYPNVSCKLSGLVTEADKENWRLEDLKPYVNSALEYFGSRRLMFGSDWPVCLLAATYDRVLESAQSLLAELNEDDRCRIFEQNAKDFYRLG